MLVVPRSLTASAGTAVLIPDAATLFVSVIGGASFVYGGHAIDLRNRKGCAILAYLALSETREVQRERLVGLFWSEFSEHNARATLRQALHEVRDAMRIAGCRALLSSRTAIGLLPGSFQLDLHGLLNAVAAGDAPELLLQNQRVAESLLAGFEDLDPSFRGWLLARRQTLHDHLIRGLEEGYRDTTLPLQRRRRLAEAALRLDPTHEEACRIVMRIAAENGELSTALRAYDELYRLLGDDYDMEPSAPTQELVADIKQGKFDKSVNDGLPALSYEAEMRQALVAERRQTEPIEVRSISSKPALFVEEFERSGIGPDQSHLVEGFRTELIACLSRFREWYVTGVDGDLAADHGGVPVSSRFAVTTAAYRAGSSVNVVMVLHERPSHLAIWGERFELRLDRWLEVQQRIVRRIAATLNVQISTERLMRLSHMPEVSLEAHDIWLRGQVVINGYKVDEWNRTAQMLARAIAREPTFSPLYSSLAQMNNVVHFVQPGRFRDEAHVERTLKLAQRAVLLDPRDSRAQLCLGWALAFCRRYSQAELHMEIACELNNNDSHTLMSSAAFYAYKADTERALEQATASMELSLVPTLTQWQYLANIRFLHGDFEGTIVAADRAQDGLLTMPALRAAALCKLGRMEEARHDVARFYTNVRAAWSGDDPPTTEIIGRWLLHIYPFSRAEAWRLMRDGIALTGIPVEGLTYHG